MKLQKLLVFVAFLGASGIVAAGNCTHAIREMRQVIASKGYIVSSNKVKLNQVGDKSSMSSKIYCKADGKYNAERYVLRWGRHSNWHNAVYAILY